MTTTFPGAVDSYTTKVDNVTDVLASHINDLQDAVVAIETEVLNQPAAPNELYHSLQHDIWPEGTSEATIADDTYVAGVWNVVHNGKNIDVDQYAASKSTGTAYSAKGLKITANEASVQAGILQFLSAEDTRKLQGKTLSFQVRLEDSVAGSETYRMAILKWTGTADTITSDVVSSWATTPSNPTLATNWEYLNTPADIDPAEEVYSVDGIEFIDLNAPNLAVFIWSSSDIDTNDWFGMSRAKLEIAASAGAFAAEQYAEELVRVQRFFIRLVPAAANAIAFGINQSTTVSRCFIPTPTTMYKTPSIVGTVSNYAIRSNGVSKSTTSIDNIEVTPGGVIAYFNDSTAGLTAFHASAIVVATGSLDLDARL